MIERTQRRLAAIVSADVVGNIRVIRAGVSGAPATHRVRRIKYIEPMISAHYRPDVETSTNRSGGSGL